jgi:hypothetical protein
MAAGFDRPPTHEFVSAHDGLGLVTPSTRIVVGATGNFVDSSQNLVASTIWMIYRMRPAGAFAGLPTESTETGIA